MAEFHGTREALKRYIGPYLRNIVQQLTKRHKTSVGACQHCGAIEALDAAHIHGRSRTEIIDLLIDTKEADGLLRVNLREFEEAFKLEHDPLEKAILVLCKNCHSKYDSNTLQSNANFTERNRARFQKGLTTVSNKILPISLDPPQPDEFKARLLTRREAIIEVHYVNGDIDRRTWNARRFSESSNIFGNLRSRPEFRKGVWQEMGIVKVCARVVD